MSVWFREEPVVNTRRSEQYALFVFRRVTGCLTPGMPIQSAGEDAKGALEQNSSQKMDPLY